MNNTANGIINNLADRFSEVVDAVSPAVERVSAISQTIVQETANAGFVYTMVGLGVLCLIMVCITILIWADNCIADETTRGVIIGFMVVGIIVFIIVGFSMIMVNMSGWIAPTRQVIREIVEHIQ